LKRLINNVGARAVPRDGSDHMTGRLDMNGKKIINVGDTTYQESDVINYRIFQRERFEVRRLVSGVLPLDGTKPMTGNLDMGNKKITNLYTDAADLGSAANVRHVNNAKADLLLTVTERFNKKINESHISSSASKKRCFPIHHGGG